MNNKVNNNYLYASLAFFLAYFIFFTFAEAQVLTEKQNDAHINLLENAGFESSLAKWNKTVSGSSTTVMHTNFPLTGKVTLRLQPNAGAANVCSNYYPVKGLKNGNAELGVRWRSDVGVSGTAIIKVQDVSGTVLTQFNLINTGADVGLDSKLFSFGDKNVRTCIDTSATSPYNYVIDVDDVWMGSPRNVTQGPIVTNWETYTPAITGFGTVTNSNLQWRRVGDTLKIRGSWTGGSNTGTARIPFPNGVVATASSYNAKIIGGVRRDAGGSTYLRRYNALVLSNDTNAFALGIEDDQSADPTVPVTGASANFKILGELTIPIQGWATTGTAFTGMCKDAYECENDFSANISSSGVISDVTPTGWLTGNCSATSPYSCPLNTNVTKGDVFKCWAQATSSSNMIQLANATSSTITVQAQANTTGSFRLFCKRNSSYVQKKVIQGYLSETVQSDIVNTKIAKGLVAGATETTGCSSSPCTLYRATKNVTSVTRSSTGQYVLNFSGFIRNPTCTFVVQNNTTSDVTMPYRNSSGQTSNTYAYNFHNPSATVTDVVHEFVCFGD